MNTQLAPTPQPTALAPRATSKGIISKDDLEGVLNIARVLSASGFFQDAKDEAQCAAKILAGLEYNFAPITSMKSFHVITIGGRVSLEMTAAAKAGVIKRSGQYTTRIRHHDATRCAIETFERDPITGTFESLGTIEWTIEKAKAAKLTNKDVWQQYPEDMLYARCISRIAKRHTPELFAESTLRTEEDDDEAAAAVLRSAAAEALPATTTTPRPTEPPEVTRRRRRAGQLFIELEWTDADQQEYIAGRFGGRTSVERLSLDELGQLIDALKDELEPITDSQPAPADGSATPPVESSPGASSESAVETAPAVSFLGLPVEPAAGGPYEPATDEDLRTLEQSNDLADLCTQHGLEVLDVQAAFQVRYGHPIQTATQAQFTSFIGWVKDQIAAAGNTPAPQQASLTDEAPF